MTLNYFYKTGELHRNRDGEDEWDGDDGYDFDYDIDSAEVKVALKYILMYDARVNIGSTGADPEDISRIIKNGFNRTEKALVGKLIDDKLNDIQDLGALEEFAECYRDEITDYYEDDAMESQE